MKYRVVRTSKVYNGSSPPRKVVGMLLRGKVITRTGAGNGYIRYGNNGWVSEKNLTLLDETPAPEPKYVPGWALSQAGRKARYGATEDAVRAQLVKVRWKGKTFSIHKKEHVRFRAWIADIDAYEKAHGKNYVFHETYSFAWRRIRGGVLMSNHSFGIAIDINPDQNPMQLRLKYDIPDYFISFARKHQIRWGGTYKVRKDAMHFEL